MPRSLRPGLAVVRRDDGHLQVGVDAPHRAILTDSPDVRRVLASLLRQEPPVPGATTSRVLATLDAAGLLVDRPGGARPTQGRQAAAVDAAWARHGDDAGRRLAARAAARVSLDAPADAAEDLARLLGDAGVWVTTGAVADVHAVVTHGPVPRERLDSCLRAGTPHLVVAGAGGGYVVGPFVLPGVTGCLRCDDAVRGETDLRRAVVVEQASRLAPLAPDPVLLALALAWAARDVLAWIEGERPSTWGASYDLGSGPVPARAAVARHPHCGCAWAEWLAG